MRSYNDHTESHVQKFQRFREMDRPEYNRFVELVSGNDVLDLGCGGGADARYFSSLGFEVTAIDLSSGMLTEAKEEGTPRLVQMDIEHLAFAPDSFDAVWAVTSLLHVPKPKMHGVLDDIDLLLGEQGLLYVCLKEGEGEAYVPEPFNETIERYFVFWQEQEMQETFSTHFDFIEGFRTVVNDKTTMLQQFYRKKQ